MTIGAVILAAGFSRRLGRPKQDLLLHGETLLTRAIHTAQAAGLHPIFVILRDPQAHPLSPLPGVTLIRNHRAAEGMATSVVIGAHHAQQHELDGLVLMTCDQPALRPDHLRALSADPTRITGSRYAARTGVPAFFPAASFHALQQLQGDAGARALLQQAAYIADESLALDIDTEAEYLAAQQLIPARQEAPTSAQTPPTSSPPPPADTAP